MKEETHPKVVSDSNVDQQISKKDVSNIVDCTGSFSVSRDKNDEAIFESKPMLTIVISTYNRPLELQRAVQSILNQTYQDFEIIIVGDHCPTLESTMQNSLFRDKRIRWFNLDRNYHDGGTTPKNYALKTLLRTEIVSYLDDDNHWTPDHLEELIKPLLNDSKIQYSFSNIVMDQYRIRCREPKQYRIDTSSFMHRSDLLKRYGYWKSHAEVGYAHDWELVSRWNKETYACSDRFSLIYQTEGSLNNPEAIYHYYGDQ